MKHITQLIKRGSAVIAAAVLVLAISPAMVARAQNLNHLPVGWVVNKSSMALPADLQPIATGKRIMYVSTNIQGQKIVVSGAIITPKAQPAHPKIVAWAHGTTGIGDHCAPSQNLNVFWPEAVAAVKSYLQKGWTVAATDYPGLGTPGAHPYLVGESEARSIIDSVRAARNLDGKLTNRWSVTGHSQGGQAALFASEIADTYGGGLSLKSAVAIAPVSNASVIAPLIPGTPAQGYLLLAIFGLAAVDPSIDPQALLAQPAKDRLSVLQTGCHDEILGAYANLTAEELLVGGQLPDSIIAKFDALASPAQQPATSPVLLVQGTADQAIPADLTTLLHSQLCANNVRSYLHVVEGATHDSAVTESTGLVAGYLLSQFVGLPAPSNC